MNHGRVTDSSLSLSLPLFFFFFLSLSLSLSLPLQDHKRPSGSEVIVPHRIWTAVGLDPFLLLCILREVLETRFCGDLLTGLEFLTYQPQEREHLFLDLFIALPP